MIYELHTSTGQKIRIDDDDLQKISDNADQFMVKLKQGIVRPPFISVIVPTGEDEWITETKVEYRNGAAVLTKGETMKKLSDLMTIPPPSEPTLLSGNSQNA